MKRNIYRIILMTLSGTIGSMLTGFVFFGTTIFSPHLNNFLFASAGLYGSLFFSLLKYGNRKNRVFAMIAIYLFDLIIFSGRSISITLAVRDILWLGGLFLSIYIYHHFIERNKTLKLFLRPFALAFIYGIFSALTAWILFSINVSQVPPPDFIYKMGKYGVLIGLGIGIGTDLYLRYKTFLPGSHNQ